MSFLRIHAQPGRAVSLVLSWFLFAAGITAYFYVAIDRHRDNPDDRVMPTIAQMVQAFQDAALKPAEEENAEEVVTDTVPSNGHGEKVLDTHKLSKLAVTGNLCPECGCNTMVYEEGCRKCYTCGHSEC